MRVPGGILTVSPFQLEAKVEPSTQGPVEAPSTSRPSTPAASTQPDVTRVSLKPVVQLLRLPEIKLFLFYVHVMYLMTVLVEHS